MQDNNDMYASEAESAAVIQTDKRTAAEKRLDAMLEARGVGEQGADSVAILRGIAVELIGQPAAVPPGWRLVPVEPTAEMIHAVRFAGDPDRPAIGERIAAGETTYPYVGADVALRMCRAILNAAPSDHIPDAGKMVQAAQPRPWVGLTDADREAVFNSLPDALEGFLKKWGWLHFSKATEAALRAKNEVK